MHPSRPEQPNGWADEALSQNIQAERHTQLSAMRSGIQTGVARRLEGVKFIKHIMIEVGRFALFNSNY